MLDMDFHQVTAKTVGDYWEGIQIRFFFAQSWTNFLFDFFNIKNSNPLIHTCAKWPQFEIIRPMILWKRKELINQSKYEYYFHKRYKYLTMSPISGLQYPVGFDHMPSASSTFYQKKQCNLLFEHLPMFLIQLTLSKVILSKFPAIPG